MNKYQIAKKEKGICLTCDDPAVPGKTRCKRCLEVIAAKQRIYYQRKCSSDPDYAKKQREYYKKWMERNPDKVAVYKSRRAEYNRRYTWGGLYEDTKE